MATSEMTEKATHTHNKAEKQRKMLGNIKNSITHSISNWYS